MPFEYAEQLDDILLTTHVNGELRQDDRTGRMLFPIRRQIAYISTFTTLVAGDIIITGIPTGAGARFDPPLFLKPGDKVTVSAEGIGSLTNSVEDEILHWMPRPLRPQRRPYFRPKRPVIKFK